MTTLNGRTGIKPAVLFRKLFKLERTGRYADALMLISGDRNDIERLPDLDGLDPKDQAQLMLRYGSLIGFYGHSEMIAGAQEHSKNVLTEVRETFLELSDLEKAAEAENLIALAFWRTGEYQETDLWLDAALAHDLPQRSRVRLYSYIIRSLNFLSLKKHQQNIAYCRSVETEILDSGDAFLNGGVCTNLATSLKDISANDEALYYFGRARHYFELARHRSYRGLVENNLALLYMNRRKFQAAHDSVDAAIGIYKKLHDKTREGSSLETKAQICLTENKTADALSFIDRSIAVLRKSENQAYLAESLMTRAKILLDLDKFQDAVFAMMEAVEITRRQTGEAAARQLIDEFQAALGADINKEIDDSDLSDSSDDIELVIPASLSKYGEYSGVWINNTHLDDLGIPKGSLAVTVNEKVNRGDLVAAVERNSGAVLCGYYDADFGMVCLETGDGQPHVFDENAITIKGKIVGVCRDGENADGKLIVKPIGPAA